MPLAFRMQSTEHAIYLGAAKDALSSMQDNDLFIELEFGFHWYETAQPFATCCNRLRD